MKIAVARSVDLLAVAVLACAGLAIAFVPSVSTPVRALLALPLVCFLPGYAFTAAVMPQLDRWSAESVAFALGSSLAIAVLAGLALNYTPWGLERRSWAVALACVTVVAAAGAAFRRARSGPRAPRPHVRLTRLELVLVGVAILLSAVAVGVSRLGAINAAQKSTFTQLWMLPTRKQAAPAVQIGVANHEGVDRTYRLVIRAGERVLLTVPRIAIRPGREWVRDVTVPRDLSTETPVEADLFRVSKPGTVYRHVTFWPQSKTAGRR